jgi:hypothetical protein
LFLLQTQGLAACAYPETVLVADERLCAAVRLCDTREYLDTLSLSSDAVGATFPD